jgi:hypothetical protein
MHIEIQNAKVNLENGETKQNDRPVKKRTLTNNNSFLRCRLNLHQQNGVAPSLIKIGEGDPYRVKFGCAVNSYIGYV